MNKKLGMSVVLLLALMLVSMANAATNWRPAANGIFPPATGNWNTAANWNHGLPGTVAPAETKAVLNAGAGTAECQVTDVQGAVNVVIGDGGPGGDVLRIMSGGDLTSTDWLAVGYSRNCQMIVEEGGVANLNSHLWMAATNVAATNCILDINGGTVNVGGNIGLGTVNASTPSGGTAFINVNAGTLALDHWSATGSIQNGSVIDIELGVVTILGNQTSTVVGYEGAGKITAYGGTGTVHYDITTNPGKTTIWAEPASVILGTGDVNGDGNVDATDLFLFAAQWLQPTPDPDADFTGDQKVNMEDFQILAKNWHHNQYSRTLTGKIMCGYQGWFNHPGDGAGRGWTHWGSSNKFEPGYCTVDWWPDMSEYDADEKYPTGFNYSDGSTAYVFSSHNEKTVLRHFSWMEQYGIDGVFLQRFASETTPGSSARNHRDQVMLYCQEGANLHKRAWAMMYDLSSTLTGPQLKQKVIDDWKHLVDTYQITQDPTDAAYLHHKGKPVVAVWGLGFERAYEGQDTYDIINFLKNDPIYGGCTVMIGVDNEWRERKDSDTWLQQIVALADIISPWAVGRYGSKTTGGLDNFTNTYTIPDQIWCNANNKDYLPVVFPGFSWQNLKQNNKFDQTPRLGGAFLWRQIYKAINDAGVTMIYQAMFDEVDEGTAIFKCTNAPPVAELPTSVFSNPFLPTGNAQHAPYDPSDASLPSDHYLWLVGQAAQMLTGERIPTETMPIR